MSFQRPEDLLLAPWAVPAQVGSQVYIFSSSTLWSPHIVLGPGRQYASWLAVTNTLGGGTRDEPQERIALDLTQRTSRQHAAWACEEKCPNDLDLGNALALYSIRAPDEDDRNVFWSAALCTGLDSVRKLNSNDLTLLPDGSRYVDALLLKAFCEHCFPEETP